MGGLLGRFLASLVLVLTTYNPTGMSFISWIAGNFPHIQPIQAVVGVVLLALWIFFAHATWRSLGTLGVALGLAGRWFAYACPARRSSRKWIADL
jgi:hypothetical protein